MQLKKTYLLALFIFICATLQYANTFNHGYAFDDFIIVDNEHIQKGVEALPYLWTHYLYPVEGGNAFYRPFLVSSFALEYEFFGKKSNISHILQVFYFGLMCVILFLTLQKIFPQTQIWIIFFITLVYVVHPINVEVVANLKSRDNIFSFGGCLLSLYFFLQYAQQSRWYLVLLSILSFVIAFLSRENTMTFLAVYPLALYFTYPLKIKSVVRRVAPLYLTIFSLTIIYVMVRMTFIPSIVLEAEDKIGNSIAYVAQTFTDRYATIFVILLEYLQRLTITYPLVYESSYEYITLANWLDIKVIISIIIHITLLAFSLKYLRKRHLAAFGILFYIITLSIYSHIVKYAGATIADRYQFMAVLGYAIVLVTLLSHVFSIKEEKKFSKFIITNKYFFTVLVLILMAYSCRTFERNKVWKNNLTLFTSDMKHLTKSGRANNYYVKILTDQWAETNFNPKSKLVAQIIEHSENAIRIFPQFYRSYTELAGVYIQIGQLDKAEKYLQKSLQIKPTHYKANFYLGKLYYQQQQFDKAVPLLKNAINYNINQEKEQLQIKEAYQLLGRAYTRRTTASSQNNFLQAEKTFLKGLNKYADDQDYKKDLIQLYLAAKKPNKALQYIKDFSQKNKQDPQLIKFIIQAYTLLGDTAKVLELQQKYTKRGSSKK